jgi:malate permease and related proteins
VTAVATTLFTIVGPLFVLIVIGGLLEIRFGLDIRTLSKISFFVLIPAILFVVLAESQIAWYRMGIIAFYQLCLLSIMLSISWFVGKICGFSRSRHIAFMMGASFSNAGNFGIPLVSMIFTTAVATAVSYQSVTVLVHNVLMFSIGVLLIARGKLALNAALKRTFTLPLLYALFVAIAFEILNIDISNINILWQPLRRAADGLIVIALLTVGIQLVKMRRVRISLELVLSVILKLLVGPVVARALVFVFQIEGMLAALLIIAAGAPTSVNTALIGVEFDNEAELATSIVGVTTILSLISISVVISIVLQSSF